MTAGQSFTVVVTAEDQFNNVDTTFDGNVTLSLPGSPGFPVIVPAKDGIATFAGLTVGTAASGSAFEATSSGLIGRSTSSMLNVVPPPSPPPPPPPAPTVALERVLNTRRHNKKGKPIGKPVFGGFQLQYSTTMNASTAGSAADYQVESKIINRIKRKTVTAYKPVKFTTSYNAATNTVTLNVKSATPFAKGGEITVSRGVTDQAGTPIGPSDTTFAISPKAKNVTLD